MNQLRFPGVAHSLYIFCAFSRYRARIRIVVRRKESPSGLPRGALFPTRRTQASAPGRAHGLAQWSRQSDWLYLHPLPRKQGGVHQKLFLIWSGWIRSRWRRRQTHLGRGARESSSWSLRGDLLWIRRWQTEHVQENHFSYRVHPGKWSN